jgi:deazaflavin-dependent oxidoreductase (nitroreductase family)
VSDFDQQVIDEFRAGGGRVSGLFEGAEMILLHHIGAKSGAERVTPLVHFPEDDQHTILIASAGGAPKHPAWFHNLKANPKIDVEVGTETYPVVAEEITGAERDELWNRIVAKAPHFGDYQRKTERLIPLLRLTRVG